MSNKRLASSPLVDSDDKRQCLQSVDSSFVDSESDPDATIIDTQYTSSCVTDSSFAMADTDTSKSVKDEVRAALTDPDIISLFSKCVAAEVQKAIVKEISVLKEKLFEKDREIQSLQDKVDELEQCGRRNSVRINGVPETEGENTDEVIRKIAKEIGVDLNDSVIDRSHRVGRKAEGGMVTTRAIIVKFTSYRHKQHLFAAKKKLARVNARALFSLPAPSTAAAAVQAPPPRIYINDHMTQIRDEIAAAARASKKKGKVTDTWVRDGVVFVKTGDTVHRVTTRRMLGVVLNA
ncbi:hypothetical protein ACOMHN_052837 [Nucella lapillus]